VHLFTNTLSSPRMDFIKKRIVNLFMCCLFNGVVSNSVDTTPNFRAISEWIGKGKGEVVVTYFTSWICARSY
jgi:hypothetical protein